MNNQPFSGRFNRLIGLSRTLPNCLPDGMDNDDINKIEYIDAEGISQPGSLLYATDIDSLNLDFSEALDDCGPDSIWAMLQAARTNGLITMETDLLAAIDGLNRKRLQPFKGQIGRITSTGFVPKLQEGDQITVKLQPRTLNGAYLKVLKIGLLVSHDVDVLVNVPGLDTPEIVVCSANTPSYTTLSKPLLIPLDGESKEFSYIINGFRPRNNKLNCDCGGQQERINQYFSNLIDTPAMGLLLIAEAGCDVRESIYQAWEDEGAASRVIAATLRLITLANVIQRIITSGRIDRFTIMSTDELYGKRNSYMKDYADRISWLASDDKGINLAETDCYYCKQTEPSIKKRGILS